MTLPSLLLLADTRVPLEIIKADVVWGELFINNGEKNTSTVHMFEIRMQP